jgi:hypothetical protein
VRVCPVWYFRSPFSLGGDAVALRSPQGAFHAKSSSAKHTKQLAQFVLFIIDQYDRGRVFLFRTRSMQRMG